MGKKTNYTTLGMPDFSLTTLNSDGTVRMLSGISTPRKGYKIPGTRGSGESSKTNMDRAKEAVRYAINDFESKPVGERISALESLPDLYRDLAEEDIKRLKLERKKLREEQDEADEKRVREWAKKKVDENWGDIEGVDDRSKETLERIYSFGKRVQNVLGGILNDGTNVHATSVSGDIDANKDRQKLAEKYKELSDLQEQLEILEHDRDKYIIPSKDTNPDYDEHLRHYDELIAKLRLAIANPELQEYARLYKADYVGQNSYGESIKNFASNLFSNVIANLKYSPQIAGPAVASQFGKEAVQERKNDIVEAARQERINSLSSAYDQYAQQELQKDKNYNIDLQLRQQMQGEQPSTREQEIEQIKQKYDAGRRAADNFIKDRQKEIDVDSEEYAQTLQLNERLNRMFDLSKEYKQGKEVYQDADPWEIGWWYYEMPSLIGSSNSSYNQIIGNTTELLGTLAAAGMAPYTAGGSLAVYNAAIAASTPFQLAGGFEENAAERSEKKLDNIMNILRDQSVSGETGYVDVMTGLFQRLLENKQGLGLSDEYIKERYCGGKELSLSNLNEAGQRNLLQDWIGGLVKYDSPVLRKADFESSKGLQALYDADNMRTMGETFIQKGLTFMPSAAFLNSAKGFAFRSMDAYGDRILAKSLKNKIVPNAEGKITAEVLDKAAISKEGKEIIDQAKRYSNGFRRKSVSDQFASGFEQGSTLAAIAGHGIAGTTIAGIAGGATKAGATLAKYALSPKNRALIEKFEERFINKYQGFYDKLMFKKEWPKLVAAYGIKQAKGFAYGAFTEGAEEAVQHLNTLENYADKYGYSGMRFSDMIVNDIAQGNKVTDAYLSLLGLGDSALFNDYDFRTNWISGAMLGGTHMGAIRVPFTGVYGLYKDLNTLQVLDNAACYDREVDKISRVSYRAMATEAMNNRGNNTIDVLNRLQDHDARREDPKYTQKQWDEQLQAASEINRLTKDKTLRYKLERNGIYYGTNRYATAIADIYTMQKADDDILREYNDKARDINNRYMSKAFSDAVDKVVDSYTKEDIVRQRDLYEERKKYSDAARKMAEAEVIEVEDPNAREERIRDAEQKAFDDSLDLIRSNVKNVLMNKARIFNKLMGLLKVRAQSESIDQWYNTVTDFTGVKALRPDAKIIKDSVDKQIKQIKSQIKDFDENFDINMSDADLLNYIENDPDYINVDSDNIQQLESALVMLNAEKEVNDSHYATLNSTKNRYAKRIDAIDRAESDNAKLDTLINEVYNGDAVTELFKIFAKEDLEDKKAVNKAAAKTVKKEEDENTIPFTDLEIAPSEYETKLEEKLKETKSNLAKNKALYEKRKAKARESYLRRKNKYKNFKKRTAGMSIMPFEEQFVAAANMLIRMGETGAYKFEQFVQDIKDIASEFSVNELLPVLKQLYIKSLAKYQYSKPEILQNLSTVDEVISYGETLVKKLYVQPDVYALPVVTYIQKKLQENYEQIDKQASSYYDTFVDDGGVLTIYSNTSQIDIDMEVVDRKNTVDNIINQLEQVNTSDGEFLGKLKEIMNLKLEGGFPADAYVKYRNVEGGIPAIARACISWDKNDSIRAGITIANLVAKVLSGQETELPVIGELSQYNTLVSKLKEIRDSLNSQGYSVVDGGNVIYGTDEDGNNIASTVDVILVHNDTGEIYVIDVRSSYLPIARGWDSPVSIKLGIKTTVGESLTQNLHQIERILSSSRFKFNVSRLGVLPIIYDRYDRYHPDRIELDNDIISVPTQLQFDMQKEHEKLEDLWKQAQYIVNAINDIVDEYNDLVDIYNEQLKNIEGDSFVGIDYMNNMSAQEQPDIDSYNEYLQQLLKTYNDIVEQLDNAQSTFYSAIDSERQWFDEIAQQQEPEIVPTSAQDRLVILSDACRQMDMLATMVPTEKASEQEDRENIKLLYKAIFDAQVALDEVLENDDENVDVSEEEELIASVMEKLVESNENFTNLNKFIQRWWVVDFSKDISSNTSTPLKEKKRLSAYRSKIKTWVNTLSDHVLNDLENHPKLQSWYSSLLNKYLKRLVDNFERYEISSEEYGVDAIVLNDLRIKCINDARDLIQSFNLRYFTEPYPIFDDPEQERLYIEKMDVSWPDHYGPSRSHSPAFDSMKSAGRGAYARMSVKPDFITNYITQDTNIAIDPNHTTRLTLWEKNGRIVLTTQYWDKAQNREQFADLDFEIDIESAARNENVSPELLDYFKDVNLGNKKFTNQVRAALNYVKRHPDYKIVFNAFMNKGSIVYDKNRTPHNVSEWLFTGVNSQNLYTINLSRETQLGIARFTYTDKEDRDTFYDIYTGDELSQRLGSIDDVYTKQLARTETGLPVFFRDMGDGLRIATPLIPEPLAPHAVAILGLLQRYAEGNKTTQQGFDILELLKMRLHFAKPGRKITPYNNINNTVLQFSGKTIRIGEKTYDVFNDAEELVKKLQTMKSVVEWELASENIAYSNNPIFSHARMLFSSDRSIHQIDLGNGFTIYRDDVEHDNGNKPKGSTWIGHLLRTGSLYTTATGETYRQINIRNLGIIPRTQQQSTIKEEKEDNVTERQNRLDSRRRNPFDSIKGLAMSLGLEEIDITRSQSEREAFDKFASDFFEKVLGSPNYKKEVEPYIQHVSENKYAVGITTSSLILLSLYAPYTAVYHEAFHKVLELLLPASTREQLYSIYRQHNPDAITDRDVAEGMADMFVDYTENYVNYKQLKWTKKLIQFYKPLFALYRLASRAGIFNIRKFMSLYRDTHAGKFANNEISQENIERFKNEFGDALYYEVKNRNTKKTANFKNIGSSTDLAYLISALEYYIIEDLRLNVQNPDIDAFNKILKHPDQLLDYLAPETIDLLTAKGVPDDELIEADLVFRELFEFEYKDYKDKKGKVHKKKVYPKFDAISDRVVMALSARISDYKEKILPEDQDEDEKVQNQNIDRYDRASYEFKKLDGATQRTKMFFATVPYLEKDENAKGEFSIKKDYSKNKYSLPTLMPLSEVYNRVVNDLHHIKSHEELRKALAEKAKTIPMYKYLSDKYEELFNGMYEYDDLNNIIHIDYEKESFALQIAQTISSQKIQFCIAYSKKENKDSNAKTVTIMDSSENVDERWYPQRWSQALLSGQTGVFSKTQRNGNYVLTKSAFDKNGVDIFKQLSTFLNDLRTVFVKEGSEFTFRGVSLNKYSYQDMNLIKYSIVARLNKIGINIDKDAFDYMLEQEFGDSGYNGISMFLTASHPTWSISSFITLINSFVKDYQADQNIVKTGYTKNGLVKILAKYQGAYQRISTDQSALGLNGKRYYSITQNHTISYITDLLASGDKNNPFVNRLQRNEYSKASIIQKAIKSGNPLKMACKTLIGFRTDERGDSGSEYSEEDVVEDFMAKMQALQQGYMIPLTLADKGTYPFISGVPIPGMKFIKVKKENSDEYVTVVQNAPTVMWIGKNAYIRPCDAVLTQMLEYVYSERNAILQCMEDLGYEKIDGYEKQGRPVLKENQKIKNYHTPNKGQDKNGNTRIVEPNGTRFLSFTQMYIKENGKLVPYNLNDPNKSSADLLKLANEKFFDLTDEDRYDASGNELSAVEANAKRIARQKDILAYTLALQNYKTVLFAVDHGMIERTAQALQGDATKTISADWNSLLNLSNIHLSGEQIAAVQQSIFDSIKQWKNEAPGASQTYHKNLARSLAIAAILADGEYRSIISYNEFTRNFMGNPAFYKVDYDYEKGIIKDSSYDIQKRIGGLVSTGDDNMLDIPGMPKEYTCAECKDYEVGSTSQIISKLDDLFETGTVREAYAVVTGDWEYPYTKTAKELIEEVEKSDDKQLSVAIEKAVKNAKIFGDAYKSRINVADGAAYITADMCKNMLRMRGQFTELVEEAFDILSGPQKYSWMQLKDAYNKIYDAVNIVTTKYTAFGFRDHQTISDLAVPYYNKFALFPLFDCIATGPMARIYDKMRAEDVDMMMMDSAVKLGSEGAVKFDGEQIGEPFNKYRQDFGFLRRQLNTDPEEGSVIDAGTQTMKIVLANLRKLRKNYKWRGGFTEVSGKDLLREYMESINALADIGISEVENMFFTNGTLDVTKLSDFLKDQLRQRNANDAILDALEVETTKEGKRLSIPLAATSETSWMESILISTINKRVINITTPGSSFVQRSVFGTEKTRKDGEGLIQGSNKLQMINEEGSMDAIISIDYFESILPEGLSFNEARLWLIDNGIIGPKASANTVGYRIPTQAQSSIHALRFIDVVPAVKSTIILPEEFTKITGSDFDIDHLYLMSYNYTKGKDGKLTSRFDKEKNPSKWHQNNILDIMFTLLLDVENSTHSLFKSIDNDTSLAEDISDKIPTESSDKHLPFNIGTIREQVLRKRDYITGKTGIGPFALNVTNQILTQLYNVSFNNTRFTELTGIKSFDKIMDYDGNYILSWISAFINGHVDIVKKPWVSKLNVNGFTYNMLNLLIRSGFGDTSLWFICQPIIKDLAEATTNALSNFLKDSSKDKSIWKARERAVNDTLLKYFTLTELDNIDFSIFTDPKEWSIRANAVNYLKTNKDALEYIATHPGVSTFTVNGKEYDANEVQKDVYTAWVTLEPYQKALGRFVQLTKIDTRKHGKTFIEIKNYLQKYEDTFYPKQRGVEDSSIWDLGTVHNFLENSWVDKKTRAAISLPFRIMGDQTFEGNDNFINSVIQIGYSINNGDDISSDFLKKISRHLITYIKSKYFVGYAKEHLKMSDSDLTGLFIGNFTIAKRLNNFIYATQYNDNYKRLAGNRLLNQLTIVVNDKPLFVNRQEVNRPEFVTVKDNVDASLLNSKDLTEGWYDILNDEDQYVRKFARDLIVYAFLTSGEFKGWNKLLKYVPPQFIRGEVDTDYESFSEFIRTQLSSMPKEFPEDVVDEIVANNSDDFLFIKKMAKEDIVASNEAAIIAKPIPENEKVEDLPQYVYINNPKQSSYCRDHKAAYKFVGTIYKDQKDYPVYVRMRHRGYHHQNTDIYQYGWDFDYIENNPHILDGINQSDIVSRAKNYLNVNTNYDDSFFDILNKFENSLYTEDPQSPVVVGVEQRSSYVLHSGGANGSDTYWGEIGKEYGVKINHYYHGKKTPNGNTIQSEEDFEEGVNKAKAAGLSMGRKWNDQYADLMGRNWNLVKYADAIYAIGHIVRQGETNKSGYEVKVTQVDGGTGYAVQMAILERKPVFVFDQNDKVWYTLDYNVNDFVETSTVTLTLNFAGIGTRDINDSGKQAIEDIYKNTFGNIKPPQSPQPQDPPRLQMYVETASAVEERAALESEKTILSNEELSIWNSAGVGPNPRILVASEHSDPAFHSEQIISVIEGKTKVKQKDRYTEVTKEEYNSLPKDQRWYHQARNKYYRREKMPEITGKDFAGLYIITKHDGLSLLNLLKTDIPKLIHFSITGLGSTKWEPGSMKPDDLLDRIQDYIKQGLDPNAVTVRIDPIIPDITTPRMIENIVKRASEMGIKRIRFSIMDTYGNTVRKMSQLGYDFSNKYHYDEKGRLVPNDDVVNSICDFMLKMKDKYGVTLGTCAENIHREGISNEGCLSVEGVNRMLGTSIEDKGTDNNKQRLLCSCYGGKVDALAYDDYCGTSCTYCYGKHENDAVHHYYNPDGTLKSGNIDDDIFIMSRPPVKHNDEEPKKPYEAPLSIIKESSKPTKTTFTFKDGTTVDAPFKVNDEQESALNSMLDFVKSDETHMTLSGYAGTGKTSIVEILASKLNNDRIGVKFCATTNTAAQILTSKVRKAGYTASTVHSTFGVQVAIDESSDVYDASNRVQQEGNVEITEGSVIIIDESSMINENIYNIINKAVTNNNAKVIYMGDPAQLPPVGETKISIIFRNTTGKIVNLTKVERTGDNAILREATAIRNGEPLSKESSFNSEGKGVAFVQRGHKDIIKNVVETFAKKISDNSNFFKILTYSNQSVSNYNIATRNALGYTDPYPIEGEPIVGYLNWGYIGQGSTRKYQFMNSESYVVVRRDAVLDASCEGISLQVAPVLLQNEFGYLVLVNVVDVKNNSKNKDAVRKLCAKKQELWKQWRVTKNRFYIKQLQNIEQFLFVNDDVFDTNPDSRGHLALLQPKVFDYGYAITVHKSQGSTYTHVLIDDYNIVNKSGYHATSAEQAKEYVKQLEYVAVSRATDTATIITTDVKNEDSPLNHVKQLKQSDSVSPEITINIYAGSGENVDLSNFADRPFDTTLNGALDSPMRVKSVEHAFQLAKLYETYDEMDEDKFDKLELDILNGTAANARSVGRNGFNMSSVARLKWDEKSSEVMRQLITESFVQNPQALQRLLSTGNATLTHVQEKGKWGKEFPRILMLVRSELASEQQNEQNNNVSYSDMC